MALCDATAVKRSILVVDDEPHIACLLRDYLQANGFAPEIIADGNVAVARAKATAPIVGAPGAELPPPPQALRVSVMAMAEQE